MNRHACYHHYCVTIALEIGAISAISYPVVLGEYGKVRYMNGHIDTLSITLRPSFLPKQYPS